MRLGLALLFLIGCGSSDECTVGQTSCEGSTLKRCDATAGMVSLACGGACVKGASGTSFCALSASADPLCAGATRSTCDGQTRVSCTEGYRTASAVCSTAGLCHGADVPVATGMEHIAVCALDAAPDTRCRLDQNSGRDGYCDGVMATQCLAGYAVQRQTCNETGTAADPCRVVAGGSVECVAGAGSTEGSDPYDDGYGY